MARIDWTEEKIEELMRYTLKGLSASEIAPYFDVSRNAICAICSRMNIKLYGNKKFNLKKIKKAA